MSGVTAFDFLPSVTLRDDDVHVWDIAISEFAEHQAALCDVLEPDELHRAGRFRFAPDRARYVVSHWFVRLLLAHYLTASPDRLRFKAGAWGKPSLRDSAGLPALEYNLSHSGDIAMVAVARGRTVGIDVEQWNAGIAHDQLAAFCFSRAECSELGRVAWDDKAAAFFAGWTRKEAFIKATGVGVNFGLDYFDVSLAPRHARLLADRRCAESVDAWGMRDLAVGHDYSAAVVARGTDWQTRRFSFSAAHSGERRGAAVVR